MLPPADGYGRARVSALRALAMDESSSDAWTALGCVMFMAEWDWIGAERSLQRALELDPRQTQARLLYGRLLDAQGRSSEGLAMKLRTLETDPFSPSVHCAIALSYWNQRRYDEAIRWANKTLDIGSSARPCARVPGRRLLEAGRFRPPHGRKRETRCSARHAGRGPGAAETGLHRTGPCRRRANGPRAGRAAVDDVPRHAARALPQ